MKKIVILLISLFFLKAIQAQEIYKTDSSKHKKINVLVTPLLGFQPETKLYGGVFAIFTFKISKDSLTRLSNVGVDLRYTMNKQFLSEIAWETSFEKQKYISKGILNFNKMPLYFFGIGSKSLEKEKEIYDNTIFNFDFELNRKVSEGLFVGGVFNLTNISGYEAIDKINLGNGLIIGDENGLSSGLGLSLVKDTRDNVLSPSEGILMRFRSLFNTEFFGSDYSYNSVSFDLRKYFPIKNDMILALQVKSNFIFGDAPFWKLSTLGSPNDMRGYYPGRFRDKHYISFQTEYRFPIFWRFEGAVFAGLGEVSDDFAKWDITNSKPTVGSGIRFVIDKEDKSKIRFDYAFGKQSNGFYISFAEAF